MRPVTAGELRQIQIDILDAFHAFCHKHGVQYSLAYGTLLGAVRHKGFIPWDDDVDVMLARPEYDKAVRLFNSDGEFNRDFKFLCTELDDNYQLPWGKVISTHTVFHSPEEHLEGGVWVDVFPIDNISSSLARYHVERRILNALWALRKRRIIGHEWHPTNAKRGDRLVRAIARLAPARFWTRAYEHLLYKYKDKPMPSCAVVVDKGVQRRIFRTEWFRHFTQILFEGKTYDSIAEVDSYLTRNYGDWETPPPATERVPMHNVQAYWRDS